MQALSYTIDIYRGKLEPIRVFDDFALYVAFFPQLVAGPIVRAGNFLPQLETKRVFSNVDVRAALTLFLVGFIKKVCIADNLAVVVDEVFGAITVSMLALFFALASALMFISSFFFMSAGEPPTPTGKRAITADFGLFLKAGLEVLRSDTRFPLFLYTQWLGGATLMALPFYVVAATDVGLGVKDVGILLAAQTAGSLVSNAP